MDVYYEELFSHLSSYATADTLTVLDVESLSPSDGLDTPRAGWYTALWGLVLLVRYADTKRLNEHLRTPRQSRINRTWLILSRKICAGKPPPPLPLIFIFYNVRGNTYDHHHYRGSALRNPVHLVTKSLRWIYVAPVVTSVSAKSY